MTTDKIDKVAAPMHMLLPSLTQAPNLKVMINIGALFDIPTGKYQFGINGESILNGGLGFLTGVVGIGNNFKSTVMHYMTIVMMARMGSNSGASTYDTEINIHEWHLKSLFHSNPLFKGADIIEDGRWQITDKTV